ncbi:hypothetical protein [Streptomyces sp. NPDC094031]
MPATTETDEPETQDVGSDTDTAETQPDDEPGDENPEPLDTVGFLTAA